MHVCMHVHVYVHANTFEPLCFHMLCLCSERGLKHEKIWILLTCESDQPEITPCGLQDIKIQLLIKKH